MLSKFSLPLLLVSAVALFAAGYQFYLRYLPVTYTPAVVLPQQSEPAAVVRLRVPGVGIDLAVYPAVLNGAQWEYTSRGVSHLSSTPWPGTVPGNSVFYGHNWPNILAPLHQAAIGQQIITQNSAGQTQSFEIISIDTVSPDHLEIIRPTSDSRLTLFTCTGFLDSKRLVLTAKPI